MPHAPKPLPSALDHALTLDAASLEAIATEPGARRQPTRTEAEAFRERYDAGRVLGRGGMGEVRLVRDRRIGREVAQKLLHAGAGAAGVASARFLREARVQGQLEHPAVVPVYDLGVTPDGAVYFTMMRVRGTGLDAVLDALRKGDAEASARHPRRRLLSDFARLCLAVDYAHARGVVHRDLKPQNVMLGDFGEVHLLDWGLARAVGAPESRDEAEAVAGAEPPVSSGERFTAAGAILGTPGYMAPEQIEGRTESLDGRADVYALGVILYELLTLAPLFAGGTAMERLFATMALDGASPAATHPERDVPPELDAACARATARDPAQRFATARALGEAVERYLDGDRDTARRRQLAAEHAARARALVASLSTKRGAEAEDTRADAMREATRALAFDPRDAEATALLARVLMEVPDVMPAAAREEMERARVPMRRAAAKAVTLRAAAVLVAWSAAASMGVRHPALMLATLLSLLTASAVTAWWWRAQDGEPGRAAHWLAMVLSSLTLTGLGALFGPVLVLPALTMVNGVLFGAQMDFRRPAALVALNAGPVLVAAALQASGALPGGVEVRAHEIVVHAGMTGFTPGVAWALMLLTAVGTSVFPLLVLGRVRREGDGLERRLFLHSWHLRNLLPAAGASPRDR